jgi:hypothetical protein
MGSQNQNSRKERLIISCVNLSVNYYVIGSVQTNDCQNDNQI